MDKSEANISGSDDADAARFAKRVERRRSVVMVCALLAVLMQVLDTTVANVAIPYMQGSLSASQDEINWVLTSYIVAAAVATAPIGFLAGRFGRTRLFGASIIGFTIASALCGASQSLNEIVLCRILQGLFGAGLVPLSQAVMYDLYPIEKRGPVMALWGMAIQVGPVIGPVLGGWLTETYNWRWVFYVNVPFGILAAIGLMTCLKETPFSKTLKIDWIGFAALSIAIGAFQIMLDRGEELDWFNSPQIVVEAVVAGLGFYIFLVQLWLAPKPYLSPKLFTDINFIVSNIVMFGTGLTMYASLSLMAPYLQDQMNYPVISAGIALAPRGFGTIFSMIFVSRLVRLIDVRVVICAGLLIGCAALYEMTFWTPDVSRTTIIIAGFFQGASVGCIFLPVNLIVFSTLPLELRTEAAAILSLLRNIGSALGISITSILLQTNTQVNHADIGANVTAFNRTLQTGAAARLWDPSSFGGAAALNQVVTTQAIIIAYADDFKLVLILSLLTLPLVLLTRTQSINAARQKPAAVVREDALPALND